ncbi:MAG: hypothetical protein J0G95_15625 [Rhizobiales bacterium]|nr:hypothetical protein [Hyphomicrobiales bacterium]
MKHGTQHFPIGARVALAAAAIVLTASLPAGAATQAPAPASKTAISGLASVAPLELTDISARAKTRKRGRHVYRNNNAAGLAFMGLALGTVGAVIAEQRRRDYYRDRYYYGGPAYYGRPYYGGPGYYGGPYQQYYYGY